MRIPSSSFQRHHKGTRLLGTEGGENGVWFVLASGTGIFINTGTTLRAMNRRELIAKLGINVQAHLSDVVEDVVALCPLARAHGYTSIQVGNPSQVNQPHLTSSCAATHAHAYFRDCVLP